MDKQTEKLREEMAIALWLSNTTLTEKEYAITSSWWKTLNFDTKKKHLPKADQILKACKEAGLRFVEFPEKGEDLTGTCLCRVKEIDIE